MAARPAPSQEDLNKVVVELHHKQQISEVLTKLFLYLDERKWDLLRDEVFSPGMVVMDNGEGPKLTSGAEIVDGWRANLEGVDAIYHQVNNYIVTFTGEGKASGKAYGSATHFKAGATQGETRTFVGLYNFELAHQGYTGWRVTVVHFMLKYMEGNVTLV